MSTLPNCIEHIDALRTGGRDLPELGADGVDLKPARWWINAAAGVTRRLPRGKSRFVEWSCRGSDRRFIGRMPKRLGGYEFDCCLRDMIARDVFLAGCFATQEIAVLRSTLKPGMTFLDIGANWGLAALVAAHLVGPHGRVIALEPDPRMFAKLQWNLARNGLQHVLGLEAAAAVHDGYENLAGHDHSGGNWGSSRLIHSSGEGTETFKVAARRLDSLLDELGLASVDLIKIDVEGAEDRVLAGMESGLNEFRYQRIVLEVHPAELMERGVAVNEITALLASKGYKGYGLDHSQAGIRRAYYHPWVDFSEFVCSLQEGLTHHAPHTLWVAPDNKDFL